jgi:hypothetical protein
MSHLSQPRRRGARAIALPLLILACGGLAACGSSSSTTTTTGAGASTGTGASAGTGTSPSSNGKAAGGSTGATSSGATSAPSGTAITAPPTSRAKSRLNSTRFQQALIVFADCLRRHGLPIPQPNTSGKGPIFNTRGVDTTSPKFRQARQQCRGTLLKALRATAHKGTP